MSCFLSSSYFLPSSIAWHTPLCGNPTGALTSWSSFLPKSVRGTTVLPVTRLNTSIASRSSCLPSSLLANVCQVDMKFRPLSSPLPVHSAATCLLLCSFASFQVTVSHFSEEVCPSSVSCGRSDQVASQHTTWRLKPDTSNHFLPK